MNISHDLKTPLSTIRGYAELLSDDGYNFSTEEVQTYAGRILKSEENITELVNELRLSASLAEGKTVLQKKPVQICPLIRTCIKTAELYMTPDTPIQFECAGNPVISVDRALLSRAVINIICNAFVHNPPTVLVSVSICEEKESVSIRISDNGKGMTHEEISRIFSRYYRGTDSGKKGGTGLGLAIAHDIISAHSGSITVSSQEGKGSTFAITLPKADQTSDHS